MGIFISCAVHVIIILRYHAFLFFFPKIRRMRSIGKSPIILPTTWGSSPPLWWILAFPCILTIIRRPTLVLRWWGWPTPFHHCLVKTAWRAALTTAAALTVQTFIAVTPSRPLGAPAATSILSIVITTVKPVSKSKKSHITSQNTLLSANYTLWWLLFFTLITQTLIPIIWSPTHTKIIYTNKQVFETKSCLNVSPTHYIYIYI